MEEQSRKFYLSWRSSVVEQLIRNQQVVGSTPTASSKILGTNRFFRFMSKIIPNVIRNKIGRRFSAGG